MSLRDSQPVTSESQPKMNDQDVCGFKDGQGNEESSDQVINDWCPDKFISFARSPADSSYPEASSTDQNVLITSTTLPISRGNSATNSANSRFALIVLNQPIEMELDDFFEIWTRGIAL